MKFAVIQVDQDYDYVEGATCLASYETYGEAQRHIDDIKSKQTEYYKKKMEYDEAYANKIEIPENLSYSEWQDFKNKYNCFSSMTTPNDFREHVKNNLRLGHDLKAFANYNPPVCKLNARNLFVVEII